jgi:hypothetical protein
MMRIQTFSTLTVHVQHVPGCRGFSSLYQWSDTSDYKTIQLSCAHFCSGSGRRETVEASDQPTVTARLVPAFDRFLCTIWFASGICSTELHGNPGGALSHPFQPYGLALTLKSMHSCRMLGGQNNTTQCITHCQVLTRLCRIRNCILRCPASFKPEFGARDFVFKPKPVLHSRIGVSKWMCAVMAIFVASLPDVALASLAV